MPKTAVEYTDYLRETMAVLADPGCLLATQGKDGTQNAMTIGWGTLGIIWGRPVFVVLVRPSRYTWTLLEENGDFTVNVPPPELRRAVGICGSKSRRDYDKFIETGLTPVPSARVAAPLIEECVVTYECRTIHKNQVMPDALAPAVVKDCYRSGDFHTLYYGQILGVLADADARERLKS
ncbi:MAG TPA: flavin reductase family protein [Planctomycetota bacterium]|nr:flavin reductase family protein [Planctomycetota bacterium]HRR79770.1 flavin reductase family protein [Planctomycetota bacterium]HRT94632.1 flavin reductase family protein [Planctomycetota bacterium]